MLHRVDDSQDICYFTCSTNSCHAICPRASIGGDGGGGGGGGAGGGGGGCVCGGGGVDASPALFRMEDSIGIVPPLFPSEKLRDV